MKRFVLTLLFLSASSAALALEVPERPDGYVTDRAGLLSPSGKARVEAKLGEFERATSTQIVVAAFPSLDGGSLEDFSLRLAEKWKIGRADRDNGAILLIFPSDRQVRIETGYGLEGALPDAVAARIIRERIVPAFRAGDFDGGVEGAVDAMILATKGEYTAAAPGEDDAVKKHAPFLFAILVTFMLAPAICFILTVFLGGAVFGFPKGLLLGLIAGVILMAVRAVMGRAAFGQTLSGRHPRGWGGGGPYIGGGWGSGGGFGGGFGGGGGGGFGGGGASGRW